MPDPAAPSHQQIAHAGTLRACQLFAGLPREDLLAIAAFVIPFQLEKGEYLFHEGERCEGFYVVQSGAVQVLRVNAAGREQVIAIFRARQSFAEGALSGDAGYPADARALESATVLRVPRKDFIELLRRRPELALQMLASMSQHLRGLVSLLDDLKLKDLESRLAHWLLKRCPKPLPGGPVEFELDRTKRVLASELGAASESLSRAFAKFRERNLVAVEGKRIVILAPLQLDELLRRNLGEMRENPPADKEP